MTRRKPPNRVVPVRSRDNQKRCLRKQLPTAAESAALAAKASYGISAKHKYHPSAYKLRPYAGTDFERTYCDEHAKFYKSDIKRINTLLRRGVHLSLWSEGYGIPTMLWTIDDNGWIYELRITNARQAEYHGYPVLRSDAFAHKVLTRARQIASASGGFTILNDPNVHSAIAAAGNFYR